MRKSLPSPNEYGAVAVLMGGWSAEREISLAGGGAVVQALQDSGVDVTAIDLASESELMSLHLSDYQRVFNIIHGRGGEDGVLQAALALHKMKCTGSGVLGSALSMDKLRTKLIWRGAGLPTPDYVALRSQADCSSALETLGLPLMVKPVLEGSSIGMSKVDHAEQLTEAYRLAARYGDVFAERWVSGTEYTAAILGREVLPLIGLQSREEFYNYEAKYKRDDTRYLCPCGLSSEVETGLQALALHAFDVAGLYGWARVDFICDHQGQPWLIEVNSVPGMTDHSLVPIAAKQAGIDFPELVQRILMSTMEAKHG